MMLRDELQIENVKNKIANNQLFIENNLYQVYQIDLIEQLSQIISYPAAFELPISYEGFYRSHIYDTFKLLDRMNYLEVAQRLIKDLQLAGWDIDLKDCYQEDGCFYFCLNGPQSQE